MHPHLFPAAARRLALALTLCLAGFADLQAQDVTVTAPQWFNADNIAAEQLPQFKGRPSLDYPRDLRKSDEQGYAIMGVMVTAKGRGPAIIDVATHPYFRNVLESAHDELAMRPATTGGKPVDSFCWYAVIFNPASTSPKAADAKPRLLAVTPAWVPSKLIGEHDAMHLPVVWVTMKLDEQGQPHDVALEAPGNEIFLPTVQEALKSWRIAPARKGGVAVSSELRVPVVIAPLLKPHAIEKEVPPKVIKRVQPVYPYSMRASRIRGDVTVNFTVTTEGRVADASVARSDNPVFDEPALEAIQKWTFEPAQRNGKPMNSRMQQAISFQMLDSPGGGDTAYAVNRHGRDPKLPPELQFDVPAKVRGAIVPVYPYALRRDGVSGKVKAVMVIDETGHVVRVQVADGARPELAMALTAALEMFSFDPALKDGKPTPSLLAFEQNFSRSDLNDSEGESLLATEKKHPERIISAATLDAPLKPISQRVPIFPASLKAQLNHGEAVVELLIDEEGRVRLPRIVSASETAFGYSAVQAVAEWRFESPRLKGKKVTARVRAPFDFHLNDGRGEKSVPPAQSAEAPPH